MNEREYKYFRYHIRKSKMTSMCLANLAEKKGWNTYYLHSGSLNIYNRKKIMPLIGFDNLISLVDMKEGFNVSLCLYRNFCAPKDSSLFEKAIRSIEWNGNKSNFINIMTIDTHGPYRSLSILGRSTEKDIYLNKYKKAARDISDFVRKAILKSKGDTVIYILSDHPAHISEIGENKNYANIAFEIKSR